MNGKEALDYLEDQPNTTRALWELSDEGLNNAQIAILEEHRECDEDALEVQNKFEMSMYEWKQSSPARKHGLLKDYRAWRHELSLERNRLKATKQRLKRFDKMIRGEINRRISPEKKEEMRVQMELEAARARADRAERSRLTAELEAMRHQTTTGQKTRKQQHMERLEAAKDAYQDYLDHPEKVESLLLDCRVQLGLIMRGEGTREAVNEILDRLGDYFEGKHGEASGELMASVRKGEWVA